MEKIKVVCKDCLTEWIFDPQQEFIDFVGNGEHGSLWVPVLIEYAHEAFYPNHKNYAVSFIDYRGPA